MKTYFIPAENMERLVKRLGTIENKCNRYGCEFSFDVVGESLETINNVTYPMVEVAVSGKAIVSGWEYVGMIEHTKFGNMVYSQEEMPVEYRDADAHCDHCNIDRFRNKSYVVRNIESGIYKQLGGTCLKDYTNGLDSDLVANYMSYFKLVEDFSNVSNWGSIKSYYSLDMVLSFAHISIKNHGFVKSGYSGSTVSIVNNMIDGNPVDFDYDIKDLEEGEAESKKALEWLFNQASSSDYIHNLQTVCKGSSIGQEKLALVVSLMGVFSRSTEEKKEVEKEVKNESTSDYVGSVGERIEFKVKSFKNIHSMQTIYGWSYMYQILDQEDNVYIWRTGKWFDEMDTIKGTVKEHNEFRGVKQTVLTRCRVS